MNRQYYNYMQQRRQSVYSGYVQQYNAHMAYVRNVVTNLQNAVAAGIDVANDPEYREQYLMLQTEFGNALFVFEHDKRALLKKEENK